MATEDSSAVADVVAASPTLYKNTLAVQPLNGPGKKTWLPQKQQEFERPWKQAERPFAP
jgi:hypothetical protein